MENNGKVPHITLYNHQLYVNICRRNNKIVDMTLSNYKSAIAKLAIVRVMHQ